MSSKPTLPSHPEKDQPFIALILTFFAINALLIYLVYARNIIFGSKAGHWDYPYFKTIPAISIWIPLAVLLCLIAMVFIASQWINTHEKWVLVGCFLAALVLQILIHRPYPYTLGSIVESDTANSFYSTARTYSPTQILSEFDTIAPSFPLHARTNMPGKILLFQFLALFTSAPQRMGYLVIALSSLGAFFLYGICVQLFQNKLVGLYAFILYALIPGKTFFFPILNTVTPVLILMCFYLFLLYIDRKKAIFLWLLGGALYFLILFEPTPLATGIIFIGILLHTLGENKLSRNQILGVARHSGAWLCAGIHPLPDYFSFDLLGAFQYVLKDAISFNTVDQRDYWIWLLENPKEFLFSAGIPVMVLFIYLASDMISQSKTLGARITHWPVDKIYILSLLATLLALMLLGINRGEITRLWIYLAAFFQVPAAYFLAKFKYGKAVFFGVACTLVIQTLITLQRVGFVVP